MSQQDRATEAAMGYKCHSTSVAFHHTAGKLHILNVTIITFSLKKQ
jgi:hypothetical protein